MALQPDEEDSHQLSTRPYVATNPCGPQTSRQHAPISRSPRHCPSTSTWISATNNMCAPTSGLRPSGSPVFRPSIASYQVSGSTQTILCRAFPLIPEACLAPSGAVCLPRQCSRTPGYRINRALRGAASGQTRFPDPGHVLCHALSRWRRTSEWCLCLAPDDPA